ncbi:ATP-binding protein [Nonomuraea sp. NN258]|uniref:ATP-binding protein n=1 Tax=Nonomuraea antri TaxID=2730852 RepID=UPI001568011C|nr:ATP-binding protein [Nonomuraea antri]NRQ40040.1 ATP-binding protein [Nonomuraea antri]
MTAWVGKDDPLLPDVLQVAGELLSNAVIHPTCGPGRTSLMLRLSVGESFFLVEVIDPGTLGRCPLPRPGWRDSIEETGRGLAIVADYSDSWGTCTTGTGRRNVWAVLGDGRPRQL